MNTPKTVQELAEKVRKNFVLNERDNGAQYWSYKGVTPAWVQEMCREAHNDMMPDDYKYQFIVDALASIADNEDADDARNSIEADIYTANLTAWLSSNLNRIEYVNQAGNDFGIGVNFDLVQLLQLGQVTEKTEIFESILNSLEEHLEELGRKAS